jgi:hypothetical protein
MRLHPNNFNRDKGFSLSHTCRPVINMLKRSSSERMEKEGQAQIGTWLHPPASYWLASVIMNGLGSYIYEAPWAPVSHHIPDGEDGDGPRNVSFFYSSDAADCPEKIFFNPVAAIASDHTWSHMLYRHFILKWLKVLKIYSVYMYAVIIWFFWMRISFYKLPDEVSWAHMQQVNDKLGTTYCFIFSGLYFYNIRRDHSLSFSHLWLEYELCWLSSVCHMMLLIVWVLWVLPSNPNICPVCASFHLYAGGISLNLCWAISKVCHRIVSLPIKASLHIIQWYITSTADTSLLISVNPCWQILIKLLCYFAASNCSAVWWRCGACYNSGHWPYWNAAVGHTTNGRVGKSDDFSRTCIRVHWCSEWTPAWDSS